MSSHKGVNLPGVPLPIPALTRKDLDDLEFAVGQEVDFVALSFVRSAADVRDLRGLIDQELAHLPEKFRLPLILCDLEARSNAEAAAGLGCPLGTLNSRLARGRQKLRQRLLRRGIALPALAAAAVRMGG